MTVDGRTKARDRFVGEILGVGTTEGTRIVVGSWTRSPFGAFVDVMVERANGHRVLFAPTDRVAEYVSATYTFDEVRVVPVRDERHADRLDIAAGPLTLTAYIGGRTLIGRVLHLLPESLTARPWFSRVCDPIARILLPGVRTHGTAGGGRHEFYGASDVHAVAGFDASWDGSSLGDAAPVEPAPRFGFGSTPREPALTRLTTTVVRPSDASRAVRPDAR